MRIKKIKKVLGSVIVASAVAGSAVALTIVNQDNNTNIVVKDSGKVWAIPQVTDTDKRFRDFKRFEDFHTNPANTIVQTGQDVVLTFNKGPLGTEKFTHMRTQLVRITNNVEETNKLSVPSSWVGTANTTPSISVTARETAAGTFLATDYVKVEFAEDDSGTNAISFYVNPTTRKTLAYTNKEIFDKEIAPIKSLANIKVANGVIQEIPFSTLEFTNPLKTALVGPNVSLRATLLRPDTTATGDEQRVINGVSYRIKDQVQNITAAEREIVFGSIAREKTFLATDKIHFELIHRGDADEREIIAESKLADPYYYVPERDVTIGYIIGVVFAAAGLGFAVWFGMRLYKKNRSTDEEE